VARKAIYYRKEKVRDIKRANIKKSIIEIFMCPRKIKTYYMNCGINNLDHNKPPLKW